MKFAKQLSVIAIAAFMFAGCKDTAKDGNPEASNGTTVASGKQIAATTETATFKIDGMTCPMGCAKTIEQKLGGMEGVQKATVDFDSKTATVLFDPAKQTPENFVKTVEKIADGAYKVSDVKSSGAKAFFDAAAFRKDKDKKKKAKKEAKATTTATTKTSAKKPACCSAAAGGKSCHGEKGGSM